MQKGNCYICRTKLTNGHTSSDNGFNLTVGSEAQCKIRVELASNLLRIMGEWKEFWAGPTGLRPFLTQAEGDAATVITGFDDQAITLRVIQMRSDVDEEIMFNQVSEYLFRLIRGYLKIMTTSQFSWVFYTKVFILILCITHFTIYFRFIWHQGLTVCVCILRT